MPGYRNWFTEDELASKSDGQYRISSVPFEEVKRFFNRATSIDQSGMLLALFDTARLGECDEALAAYYGDLTIGIATMSVRKGTPALQTVYTVERYRGKGVAYRLCKTALIRFLEAGIRNVFCDVQSSGMVSVLNRLENERPDLRSLVKERIGCSPGDEIGFDFDDEWLKEHGE